jgi:hypothetical protein
VQALNSIEASPEERADIEKTLNELFTRGVEIYQGLFVLFVCFVVVFLRPNNFTGYCDDPRNTDVAWMETSVMNFHDEDGKAFGTFKLHAGDDAGEVCVFWCFFGVFGVLFFCFFGLFLFCYS